MLITAYYFRAHTYTIVPPHVREDMERMAAIPCLHDFGCDGRPFRKEDGGSNDSGKHLKEVKSKG